MAAVAHACLRAGYPCRIRIRRFDLTLPLVWTSAAAVFLCVLGLIALLQGIVVPLALNAVEGLFAVLTKRRLKRGVFKGVADHNQEPRPFIWTADPGKIIAAASRGHHFNPLGVLFATAN